MFNKIKLIIKNKKWRAQNKHNFTEMSNLFDMSNVNVGIGTYGKIKILSYGGDNSRLKIGNFCSIANETVFLIGGEHAYNKISTYPFKAKYFNVSESLTNGDIVIEDDVWIGYGCTILSGVTIGKGAVIGAKSVVAKNIPPYSIYCGNKIIKYRFKQEIIDKLIQIDLSTLDRKFIESNIEILYKEINEDNIDDIINIIRGIKS